MSLRASNLSARADGRTLFTGLSFELAAGEALAVRGPSGSGKSVLLRQLAWLDPLPTGTLSLDGSTPEQLGAPRWRKQVTYVAQDTPPLNGSGRDLFNLVCRFDTWSTPDDPTAIAGEWRITPDAWDKRFSLLSGGERQRIFLAIALASRPTVLLLDEPTSHLDPESSRAVEKTLKRFTSVWVTHDDAQAERVGSRTLDIREFGESP